MHLPHKPMHNRLATPIRRHGKRPHVHAAHTPHRAPDAHKLGSLAGLLQQRQRRLEQVQGPEAVDGDVLLHHGRVAGGEGGEVVADARVGDDQVQGGD